MKIFAVNIGQTYIEFYNNMWTGHETIYVNGELVSKKWAFFGTSHHFEVKEVDGWATYKLITGLGWMGVTTSLKRNGIFIIEGGGYGTNARLPLPETKNLSYRDDLV